jgi:porin
VTPDKLLGDWLGARSGLAEHGILADLQLSQFYQGGASGGVGQESKYGGKLDYFFVFQGEKLGLWTGLTAAMHAETRFGEDVLHVTPLAPVNVNMLYPSLDNDMVITGLQFAQALDEEYSLTFGKINALDLFYTLYPQTGRGVDGFMNASIALPLTVGRTLPLSIVGAGVLKSRGSQIQGGLLVYDSKDASITSGLNDLFDNGANVVGLWRFFSDFGGQPGSHCFAGTWASGQFTSLDPLGWSILPGQGLVAPQQSGSWSLLYVLEQQLWVDPSNPSRNLGLLSAWGLADAQTNPFEWVCNVAVQGQGLLFARERDTIGVGYFYSGLSGDFKSLLAAAALDVGNLQGVELYYNAEITPWFHLTADLQVVEPADRTSDTALILGLRAKIDL